MPIFVESASPRRRAPLSVSRVTALVSATLKAEGVSNAVISITFLSASAMARMNREHLGHRGATDIVTFELTGPTSTAPVTGDIYICPDIARRNAMKWQVPVRQELARLVIHGTLHTLGLEHPDGEARLESPMWRAQEKYLRAAMRRGLI